MSAPNKPVCTVTPSPRSFSSVREQRELADDENARLRHVGDGSLIAQDSQPVHLARQRSGIRAAVGVRDADENEQARADLADGAAVDADRRALHPLHERLHRTTRTARPVRVRSPSSSTPSILPDRGARAPDGETMGVCATPVTISPR